MTESSANKRKFVDQDVSVIFHTLQKVVQIKAKIEQQCIENQLPANELPMSMLPTDVLYHISVSFEAMYNKLLQEQLIKSGYPKATTNYH